jgi:DNA-binding NarL/FixJ family response regulator
MSAITSLLPAAGNGSLTTAGNEAGNASPGPQPEQPRPQPQQATDTVQLTEAQQVYQLYNQGMEISQIASSLSLSLSVAAVDSYLNISTSGG